MYHYKRNVVDSIKALAQTQMLHTVYQFLVLTTVITMVISSHPKNFMIYALVQIRRLTTIQVIVKTVIRNTNGRDELDDFSIEMNGASSGVRTVKAVSSKPITSGWWLLGEGEKNNSNGEGNVFWCEGRVHSQSKSPTAPNPVPIVEG
jgi:hypothetical protein